ncbi:alpha-2,8-sialyltransferase 8E-like [Cheilinus undulatus]|uniref:alpha-2,8-sialyltransferase 8E-like n=1 Tax=Cheilinus undulatus TaxID=241271 RepID=UPI001BD23062|nr:alpha-2,8-sialyltransferase 8E-like [Cheilinus undulatus]
MRGQLLKTLFSLVITLLCLGSLLTTVIWYMFDNNVEPRLPAPQKKSTPKNSDLCKGCKEVIEKVMQRYSKTWQKKEENYKKFRSQLNSKCSGFEKSIITQSNTPVGSKLVYDGEKKRVLQVNAEIFSTFTKEHPFSNKTWDTCAVVGNGGILTDSGCGEVIDSAQFVIRCNLPPLGNGYEKHVGVKTDLVTANPSIFMEKYGALMGRRRPFVESLHTYGSSLLLLPAFSYGHNTPICLRAAYTIEDFGSPVRPIYFNPQYLHSLAAFWRSQGLRSVRLSTGIIMASLALEVCENVHLYGFWPFSNHPYGLYDLTHHYYDNRQSKKKFHAMPAEFELLMQLHSQGVLKLHLGDCRPGKK